MKMYSIQSENSLSPYLLETTTLKFRSNPPDILNAHTGVYTMVVAAVVLMQMVMPFQTVCFAIFFFHPVVYLEHLFISVLNSSSHPFNACIEYFIALCECV